MNKKTKEPGWWIKISTKNPDYIYYFGEFNSYWEAKRHKMGYIKDLKEEKAKIKDIQVKQCKPQKFTICLSLTEVDA